MISLKKYRAIAALMDRINVDTDQVIPKQFLKAIGRVGFGKNLFHDWRYLENGGPDPDFELNRPEFQGAGILVAGPNFGCGSSREHAAWALKEYGFNVLVSESYSDIFRTNCYKNGMLPIEITKETFGKLAAEIRDSAPVEFSVDLEKQTLSTPGGLEINFEVDSFRKEFLMEGLDDIAWTSRFENKIAAFEQRQQSLLPWRWDS